MTEARRTILILFALVVLGAVVFGTGIQWGLPSRDVDPYLFGERTPWTGEEILELAGDRKADGSRGADVDIDPLRNRDVEILLNETDAQRAEILIRYRLYTYQPDEMVTMMSLSSMRPGEGDFDPKLYQYGGLWIYPVGALLKAASLVGLVHVTADLAYYLDHPEAFGRFYLVSRAYSSIWGLVGICVVYGLARRLTGGCRVSAFVAALLFISMPVVINMAHEGKPHLPGAVLMLPAVWASVRYVESGSGRWWWSTAVLCGGAVGMVLSCWPVFLLLPLASWMRGRKRSAWARRAVAGGLAGLGVYLLTNPYVAINLVRNREVLRSNLSTTAGMFAFGSLPDGLFNTIILVGEGASWGVAIAGAVAAAGMWVISRGKSNGPPASPVETGPVTFSLLWLPIVPAGVILIQFILLAAGKPGEYGRFLIFPDVVLAMLAVVGLRFVVSTGVIRYGMLVTLVMMTAMSGAVYLRAFVQDTRAETTRLAVAEMLESFHARGPGTLALTAEPAPYSCPPVNLFDWRMTLLPESFDIGRDRFDEDVLIRAVDRAKRPEDSLSADEVWGSFSGSSLWPEAEISWASKPFDWIMKKSLLEKSLSIPTTQEGAEDASELLR